MREGPSRWGLLPRATCPYSEAARPAWSVLRGVALLPSQAPHPFLVFNCDIRHCVTAEECQDAVPVVNRSKGFGSTATCVFFRRNGPTGASKTDFCCRCSDHACSCRLGPARWRLHWNPLRLTPLSVSVSCHSVCSHVASRARFSGAVDSHDGACKQ